MAAPFALFLGVYLVGARHGFMLDDFAWILQSRVRSLADVFALFGRDSGFYRPAVALTFAINEWIFGMRPFGYGATNVALALACAAAIGWLARSLDLSRGAAVLASALWLLNFHGIRSAVLWISGRTSRRHAGCNALRGRSHPRQIRPGARLSGGGAVRQGRGRPAPGGTNGVAAHPENSRWHGTGSPGSVGDRRDGS